MNTVAPFDPFLVGAPPGDSSPYRRLDAFREEDASLFFGRDEAIGSIVGRIDEAGDWKDRPRFVTVIGPSGSGKSSAVSAGVLPRLRSRRPPQPVWDAVVMQPRKYPWLSLANVLVPLLDPTLSEVGRIRDSGPLAEVLCSRGGISSTIEHILGKARGTDQLLIVVDQFEELFTLTGDSVARDFVRALLEASRNAPLCILATLRSDYYGKAIALDRDLSDALPGGQVNLGPMRRDELRDVIVQPASMVRLTFDPALVERMLDDVGDEPGNLPLLEYALSELWELRAEGRLTFAAYQEIGGVAGALTRRAETIYSELSDAQKKAARRLLMRLVRVSSADEEGADTRRRARRDELGAEEWKLVRIFSGERARLVVSAKDPTSGEDGVEVAHEALIRRWDRLREWLDDDRDFLLWRQDLALYRAASPEGIPQGTLLTKASKWLRERGGELNPAEREYIEKSVKAAVRTRRVRKSVVAAAVIVIVLFLGWARYTRTASYNLRRILAKSPEAHFQQEVQDGPQYETNIAWMTILLRLGRYDDIRRQIATEVEPGKRAKQLAKLAVAMHGVAPDRAGPVLKEAIAAMHQANWAPLHRSGLLAEIGKAAARVGDNKSSVQLLTSADELLASVGSMFGAVGYRRNVADAWVHAGRPQHARQVLRAVLGFPAMQEHIYLLDLAAEELVRLGEADVGRKLPTPASDDARLHTFYELARLRAYTVAGDVHKAQEIADHLPTTDRESALVIIAKLDFARHPDLDRTRAIVRAAQYSADSSLLDYVIGELVRHKRDREVEQLIAESQHQSGRREVRERFVQHLIAAGRLDDAARVAELLKSDSPDNAPRPLPFARLGAAFARAGRRTEAENALRYAVSRTPALSDESDRDEVDAVRAPAEAILGRFYEARLIADGIENDERQWESYFAILDVYATQKTSR